MLKRRIGILTHNYPLYPEESKDAGKFVYNFAHKLAKKHKVFVFCPDYGGKKEKDTKVPVTWFDWKGDEEKFGNWKFYSPFSIWKFTKLMFFGCKDVIRFIRDNKIDYVLSFWNLPSGVFALWAKKKLGVSYSTWALGSDIYLYPKYPFLRQATRLVLKNADKVFVNSFDIGKVIKKLCGVNTFFLPAANTLEMKTCKKPNLDEDKFNFLCIARLERVKGIDILVEAAKILSKKERNFKVSFIGGGSMFADIKKLIENYKIKKVVNILGYVEDQAIVNGYLKACDCLIIPSRSESFPLVITEALQASLPMIGSNVGDMPEFIGENKLGYVFPKENAKSLAKVMEKMMKDGKNIRKTRKNSMKKLSLSFKLNRIVDKFLASI